MIAGPRHAAFKVDGLRVQNWGAGDFHHNFCIYFICLMQSFTRFLFLLPGAKEKRLKPADIYIFFLLI